MKVLVTILALSLLACVSGQGVGTNTAEQHPAVTWQQCSKSGCNDVNGAIVLDANWRWTHSTQGTTNCYTGNLWDKTLCPDPQTCAKNCVVDGADYQGTYGIKAGGSTVDISFVTNGPYSKNIGSRVYLMDGDSKYKMFNLMNREFTFDVDVSNLPCGLNGALYFVEMQADGGTSAHPTNKAGAKYGTGYCDAQCPHDMKWINGEANVLNWVPSPNDPNSGTGQYGTCCIEMDIWEANSISTAYTPHPCTVQGQYRCSGTQCGDNPNNRYGGVCDKDGCDLNTFRVGVKNFFGPGMTIDSNKPVTIVTQFLSTDGTDNGDLKEIRRYWVQNGKVIATPYSNEPNLKANSVTDQYCNSVKSLFGDKNDFTAKGGLKTMGAALKRGLVLVMSLWDDHDAHMLWLDSNYPLNKPSTTPGVARGTCATTSGVPADVESQHPNANVKFMNIKFGAINSTFHS